MNKQIEFLKQVLKSIGVNLSTEQTTALEAAKNEDDLAPFFATVSNGINNFAANQKNAGRAEVYDEAKSIFKSDLHGEDYDNNFFNELSSKKGKDALKSFTSATKERIETLKKAHKKAKSDGDDPVAADLQRQIADLNRKIAEAKQSATKSIETKDAELKTQRLQSQLAMETLLSGNLVDTFRTPDFINDFIVPNILKQMTQQELSINDNFKVVDKNGSPKFSEKNEELTPRHFIQKVVEPYTQKSPGQQTGQFQQQGNPDVQTTAFGAALAGI